MYKQSRIKSKTVEEIYTYFTSGTCIGNRSAIITNIQFDSRQVTKNSLFCALPGNVNDGHSFIPHAIQNGASAILCSNEYTFTEEQLKMVGVYQVHPLSIRMSMATISEIFYDFPNEHIQIIGVTGTDGKSTTVFFIHQLLFSLGIKSGYFSTVNFYDGQVNHGNIFRQSTPESPQIQEALHRMVKNKCRIAVLETTSHGLSEKTARTHGMIFDIGVLTNIASEHLDFHRTMEQYAKDKSNLFSKIKSQGMGIMQEKAPHFEIFQTSLRKQGARMRTFSSQGENATYHTKNVISYQRTIEGLMVYKGDRINKNEIAPFTLNSLGYYNIENTLAAVATIHQLGFLFQDIVSHIYKLKTPTGRMSIVRNDLSILPIVDYAHTPSSFSSIFPMIKKMTDKKLIVVFGSAGDRDKEKRPVQGKIASKYADFIILTDEDPRTEDSMTIIKNISIGCKKHVLEKNLFHIPSRKEAIYKAVTLAKPGDTLLFLGKGHEKTIEYKDVSLEWDEEQTVNDALEYKLIAP